MDNAKVKNKQGKAVTLILFPPPWSFAAMSNLSASIYILFYFFKIQIDYLTLKIYDVNGFWNLNLFFQMNSIFKNKI